MLRGVSIRAALRLGGVVAVLAGACAIPATASATVTFGADLSVAPDRSFVCSNPPFFHPYVYPDTCTALTVGVFGGGAVRGPQLVPDGEGVITKLRLREPDVQSSPLKLTVLRGLRTPQGTVTACCTVVSESPAFTPQRNGISEVTFNPPIPVHSITTVTGVYEFDGIALTATDANSVIPAGTAAGHGSEAYYPAAQPGQERNEQPPSLGADIQILFEADWEQTTTAPGTGGSGTGGTTPTTPVVGPVTPTPPVGKPVRLKPGQFAGGTATLPLACRLATTCGGKLQLQDVKPTARAAAAKAKKKPKKATVYGTASFKIPAGKTGQVKVKLNKAGRKLIAKRKSVTLYAKATVGGQVVSSKVTLKAAKTKK